MCSSGEVLVATTMVATTVVDTATRLDIDNLAPVTELVLAEPNHHMARRLRQCIIDDGRDVRVAQTPDALAAAAGSTFDTVVGTFLLCSVDDPAVLLNEIAPSPQARRAISVDRTYSVP